MRKYRDAPKSDLDDQRSLLDSLMGINRNNDRSEEVIHDFNDERVCKFYLLDMCCHDMFINTKMDMGPCPKVHSDDLKTTFERNKDFYMYDNMVEREFTQRITEIDRVIERARNRLEEEKSEEESNPDMNPDVIKIQAEVAQLTNEAEVCCEVGDIDKAQDIMAKIEELGKTKGVIIARMTEIKRAQQQRAGVDVNKKLRVCDICGSFLSIFDSDKRLTDHFTGKQHIGYQKMRDTLQAIKTRRDERRLAGAGGAGTGAADTHGGSGQARDRDRDREDNRDRGRERSRDRNNNSSSGDSYRRGSAGADYSRDRDNYRQGQSDSRRGSTYRDRSSSRDRDRQRRRDGDANQPQQQQQQQQQQQAVPPAYQQYQQQPQQQQQQYRQPSQYDNRGSTGGAGSSNSEVDRRYRRASRSRS